VNIKGKQGFLQSTPTCLEWEFIHKKGARGERGEGPILTERKERKKDRGKLWQMEVLNPLLVQGGKRIFKKGRRGERFLII